MMAPLPTPNHADRPELPRVRLDVRAASGRSIRYEVGSDEFLIGGASGCDLRLPVANLPPVVCQITRKSDGVRVRRLTPVQLVHHNGKALPTNVPSLLSSGDMLALAGIEITVHIPDSAVIIPKFVPLDDARMVEAPVETIEPSFTLDEKECQLRTRRDELDRRDADLIRRGRDLDQQTEELESDRVLWYRRRQEIEQELERQQASLGTLGIQKSDLDAKERDLARLKDELSALRERLLKEYQDRRDELALQQEELREANARLHSDRLSLDGDLDRRRAELQAGVEKHKQKLEAEAAGRRELLEEEFRQRRIVFEAELTARASKSETEALTRYRDQFEELERLRTTTRDAVAKAEAEAAEIRRTAEADATRTREEAIAAIAEYEPRLRELREQQERAASGFQELVRQREMLVADRAVLDTSRETFGAHQAAETERLMSWENALVDREAAAVRREDELKEERGALDRDRLQFQDDLVRLERRTGTIEDQERTIAERMREADVRLEQLKRDSAEWEETVRIAAAEQERLRAQAERLDRQREELDSQSSTLTERAGQLESQQAVLAVQRAKLDRVRQEAERETAQLAAARTREDESLAELRTRIREAEELRAELTTVQENAAQERQRLEERDSLLAAGLDEIRNQRESLAAETARLQERETELDGRAAEFAEQAGTLKGRLTQALDLQLRLEADRVAVREREAALMQAEEARQSLQEQLRRRAEDLAARAKTLDEMARQVAADRAAIEQGRSEIEAARLTIDDQIAERQRQVDERAAEVERLAVDYGEKDHAIARHAGKLKEVGMAVAAERKALAEMRSRWEGERAAALEADRQAREDLEAFRAQAAAELAALREQAPELEGHAKNALERLSNARDMLHGHLTELHDFARLSREDLDSVRTQVRQEADRLREQEESLNRAKAEHRLAVTAFRQQLIEWQGQVAEMKRSLTTSESRLDARQAAVDQAAKQVDATTQQLAEQAEQLRIERDTVVARRAEMERHLADMREWYRKKLRDLAASKGDGSRSGAVQPTLKIHEIASPPNEQPAVEELDPGDKQLGELLQTHGLVDGETLSALWSEAGRQRRTLRQVLLASGAITLYQLALIEAGNLDALVLGRFRVIDRLRATPREAMYRVFDPARAGEGVFLLRHLAEGEMQDAVHPDEFRQRFSAARDASHPNLANVTEVLEINGRPAVVHEWLSGLFSADWPAPAAHPGCWLRLASMAAAGIDAAHRQGLVHGRLTSDAFVLTAAGTLKVTGFGEPPWLTAGSISSVEPTTATDLRSYGQVVFGWSQFAARRKGASKPKPFPESLLAIIRRLEADPEPPMADTVATGRPYESATELVADLARVAPEISISESEWDKLLKHVAENAPAAPAGLKRSA